MATRDESMFEWGEEVGFGWGSKSPTEAYAANDDQLAEIVRNENDFSEGSQNFAKHGGEGQPTRLEKMLWQCGLEWSRSNIERLVVRANTAGQGGGCQPDAAIDDPQFCDGFRAGAKRALVARQSAKVNG